MKTYANTAGTPGLFEPAAAAKGTAGGRVGGGIEASPLRKRPDHAAASEAAVAGRAKDAAETAAVAVSTIDEGNFFGGETYGI